jgi:energy-coupling factor transporter ATP-binding protein EcfA2
MGQPFDSLTIHSLRGIKDLELSGLGQVNLLVGENDSGKTTVLEALALYCNPLEVDSWVMVTLRREPLLSSIELDQLRWLFPQRAQSSQGDGSGEAVHLSAAGTVPITEVTAHYRERRGLLPPVEAQIMEPAPARPATLQIERRGVEIRIQAEPNHESRAFTLWDSGASEIEAPSGPKLPVQFIHPIDHRLNLLAIEAFSEARLSGFQESIRKLLNELDPRILGLEILAPQGKPILYLQDSVAGLSPVSAFGDGIRRALLIALTLPRMAGGVLLIDEIETAIHVSALGKVFGWMLKACKQYRVQLFATTHSLEAVDAILGADTTEAEDIVGFRLARTGDRTAAKRYGEDLLKRMRYERGLDVR